MKRAAHSHNRQPNTHKKVSLTTLSPHTILHIARQLTQQNPLPTTRGRKPHYPEALILTLTLLAARHDCSYRALLALAHAVFPNLAMPALGTLCYRFGRIPEARWHAFLEWLAVQGIALEQVAGASVSQEPPLVFVDGTGVGYATPFYAQFYRGAQIRRIRSHIKVVVLGYWQGEVVWFMGASLGGAYADEGRLLEDWLLRYGCGVVGSGALLVGDGLYGHRARLFWDRGCGLVACGACSGWGVASGACGCA